MLSYAGAECNKWILHYTPTWNHSRTAHWKDQTKTKKILTLQQFPMTTTLSEATSMCRRKLRPHLFLLERACSPYDGKCNSAAGRWKETTNNPRWTQWKIVKCSELREQNCVLISQTVSCLQSNEKDPRRPLPDHSILVWLFTKKEFMKGTLCRAIKIKNSRVINWSEKCC